VAKTVFGVPSRLVKYHVLQLLGTQSPAVVADGRLTYLAYIRVKCISISARWCVDNGSTEGVCWSPINKV
jgi:hypothetical protein